MTFSNQRKTITYIVRVWAEYLDETPPHWRGVVEPVGSGEKFHFTELTHIIDIIQEEAEQIPPILMEEQQK